MVNPSEAVWLYDGDCGPCDRTARTIRNRINPPVELVRYQSVDVTTLGVTAANLADGPVLVTPDGTIAVGPESMAALMRLSPSPYRQLGSLMDGPGIRQILRYLGPRLYRRRHLLPGSNGCDVTAAPSQAA